MIQWIKTIADGLKNYNLPVKPNFKPIIIKEKPKIVPAEWFDESARWKYVVIHHSATIDGKLNDWEGIRRYHTSYRIDGDIVTESAFLSRQKSGNGKKFEKPWQDIGYHIGVEWDNGDVKVKHGRSWFKAGSHAGLKKNGVSYNRFNEEGLGLCIVGDFDKTSPDQKIWDTTLQVVRDICSYFIIDKSCVIGHREVYDILGVPREKSCPGNKFDINKFRNEL